MGDFRLVGAGRIHFGSTEIRGGRVCAGEEVWTPFEKVKAYCKWAVRVGRNTLGLGDEFPGNRMQTRQDGGSILLRWAMARMIMMIVT